MKKFLKDKSYYENLYSYRMVNTLKNLDKKINSCEDPLKAMVFKVHYTTVEPSLYNDKYEEVEKMMEKDRLKDEFFNTTQPFSNIVRCKLCNETVKMEQKEFYGGYGIGIDKILFIYKCDNCNKRRAIYHTGEEFRKTTYKCRKCKSNITPNSKFEGDTLIQKFDCNNCGKNILRKKIIAPTPLKRKIQ